VKVRLKALQPPSRDSFQTETDPVTEMSIQRPGGGTGDASWQAEELASLDFSLLIGGPLTAAAEAQFAAAEVGWEFLKKTGFAPTMGMGASSIKGVANGGQAGGSLGEPIFVNFSLDRVREDGSKVTTVLQIPLLTMLPMPSLRIDQIKIDFNASLDSVALRQGKSTSETDARSVSASFMGGSFAVMTGRIQTRGDSRWSDTTSSSYDLHISVKAKCNNIPTGLDKILSILGNSMREYKIQSAGPKANV